MSVSPQQLVAFCDADLIEPDMVVQVVHRGVAYALYNVDGDYFVTSDTCTHAPQSLSEGFVMDGEIECPRHAGRFDIRTGKACFAPCIDDLRTWTVHLIDGKICIDPDEQR